MDLILSVTSHPPKFLVSFTEIESSDAITEGIFSRKNQDFTLSLVSKIRKKGFTKVQSN
jgi:hypothetical protein